MKRSSVGPTIFSKIFNELPVPTVVFFKKPKTKPMANFAARQLFGVQLAALTKNLLCTLANGKVHTCGPRELPWNIALTQGIGARQDHFVIMDKKRKDASMFLKAFAMPIREGKTVVAAVVTFEEK